MKFWMLQQQANPLKPNRYTCHSNDPTLEQTEDIDDRNWI
jgi:hypothetical protein